MIFRNSKLRRLQGVVLDYYRWGNRMGQHWDGTESMPWVQDDGGRAAAGFKGSAGDCVARSVAIAGGLPYGEVYATLAAGQGAQRAGRGNKKPASARNGINPHRKWFRDYMAALGFEWLPTMRVGEGCRVHLLRGELPPGPPCRGAEQALHCGGRRRGARQRPTPIGRRSCRSPVAGHASPIAVSTATGFSVARLMGVPGSRGHSNLHSADYRALPQL